MVQRIGPEGVSVNAVTKRSGSTGEVAKLLVDGVNDAGFDLWRAQPSTGNMALSPASVGHVLLLARAAADERTGAAIDTIFGFPPGRGAHVAWESLNRQIISAADTASNSRASRRDVQDHIIIRNADRIWPRLDATPSRAWIDLLSAHHGADVEALDYAGDAHGSRRMINTWVSEQTAGRIPELLPAGSISAQTVLAITGVLYFQARWQKIFGKYPSVTDTFTRLDGSTIETEFMRELELVDRRGAGDGFVGAEIPYSGGAFSLLLLVPNAGMFEQTRRRLNQRLVDEIDSTFERGRYELMLPRWSSTTNLNLSAWLSDRGAAPGAYPGIGPDVGLEHVVHGADIEVNEWGTVAAAATGMSFLMSGSRPPDISIKANRPFLYLIRHRPSGLVLFAGQVTQPAQSNGYTATTRPIHLTGDAPPA